MDILDDEITSLWRSLQKHKVKYIMVGGFATNLHGFSRTTADLDLWIKNTKANKKTLGKVLVELGLGNYKNIESMDFFPGWSSIPFASGFELDIMTSIKGFEKKNDFDECYKSAPKAMIDDLKIRFLHINHLIKAKKASGRAKDKIDLLELERLRKLK